MTRRSSFSTSLGLVAGLSRGGARRDGGWRVVPGPINSAERAAVASARGRFAAFLPVGLCRYARRVGSHGGDIIGAWELADRSPSMIDRPWHKRSPRRHRGRSAITPVAAGSPLHGTRAPRSNTSGLTFRFFHVSPPLSRQQLSRLARWRGSCWPVVPCPHEWRLASRGCAALRLPLRFRFGRGAAACSHSSTIRLACRSLVSAKEPERVRLEFAGDGGAGADRDRQ